MSRWFRHYTGMMRDEKLVAVAIRSKQPVERVVWIWGAILESASEIEDGGRFEVDPIEVAYFLRADEADVAAVFDALAAAGRVADGSVVKWGDRQYQSDKSAERQARYRERKQAGNRHSNAGKTSSDVTQPSRDGVVTPQDTDTDTDTEVERKTPARRSNGNPIVILQSVIDAMAAQRWVAHCQDKGRRMSAAQAEGMVEILRQVQAHGGNPTEAIQLAIRKGWLSIEIEYLRNAGFKFTQTAAAAKIDWSKRVNAFYEDGIWPMSWGPRPGDPGCEAPAHLIARSAA